MAAELKAPKAVIFDWDNTLVDTWPLIHKALQETFGKYGLTPWTFEETKARVAHSARDAFPKLFGEQWELAGQDYQAFYQRDHLTQLRTLPLSEEVLRFLKERGVYVAVVSNKKGHNLRKEVEHLGWGGYFDRLVGSNDAAKDKPHPDPVHLALEGSGLQGGDEVWFVGDTSIDLECARNTNCVPILYGEVEAEQVGGKTVYQGFDVHHHATSHGDFLTFLKRMF